MEGLGVVLKMTVLGMAIVFFAMALFYGSMRLLTQVTNKEEKESPAEPAPEKPASNDIHQAAAVALALARARQVPSDKQVEWREGSWQAFHRQRQLRPTSRGRAL